MKFKYGFSAVAFLVMVLSDAYRNKSNKHTLTVLYESKCSDSVVFITKQLQPAYELLHDYINVQLVPFGKAGYVPEKKQFVCQHGNEECWGNLVQNCALYHMRGSTHPEVIDYVACEMLTQYSTVGKTGCIERSSLPIQSINQCVTSVQGIYLLLAAERETKKYQITFIPTVILDGLFSQEFQDLAQYDLITALCSLLGDVPECSETYIAKNNATIGIKLWK